MAPTPSSKSSQGHNQSTQMKTPQPKRLHFNPTKGNPSPHPTSAIKDAQTEHPVEVIGRIRNFPERKDKPISVLQIDPDKNSIRVRADFGYHDFSLDGISLSEEEDLDTFYKKFVQSRINGVKSGDKCTIMMYGPTGAGKSHTMFGCSKQPGIVYKSLRDILGDGDEEVHEGVSLGMFVHVTVLEIYNEELYDLLSNTGGGWPKGTGSKVKLEVMGKKAKNATYISGNEAGKISKEIQKVEKRRIVKSTLCNDRSSRSHCMIILDVPTVGGRLMLVDMAGSENIEQAGQVGFEAKLQTAKINQGNTALKRVVESIANGDSHVPFRDSKLTMLLQDSFEDDKSKILMILCASPDPKEIHKTISTLEYGSKAKCIVRGPLTPVKDKNGAEDSSSTVILGSRLAAMDEFIFKLQRENKIREKERNEAHYELRKKEEEVAALRARLELIEVKKGAETSKDVEDINLEVNKRTQMLKLELEKKLEECQRMANEFVELERKRMEEKILRQQEEVEMLRCRLEEIEFELRKSKDINGEGRGSIDLGGRIAKRLLGLHSSEGGGMVKSMDLDTDDQDNQQPVHEVKQMGSSNQGLLDEESEIVVNHQNVLASKFGDRVCLSTVFEEEEVEEEEKEIVKEMCTIDESSRNLVKREIFKERSIDEEEDSKEAGFSSRRMRIQNIFTLCGNNRELGQQIRTPFAARTRSEEEQEETGVSSHLLVQSSPLKTIGEIHECNDHFSPAFKQNHSPLSSLENNKLMLPLSSCIAKKIDVLSPKMKENLSSSSTPYRRCASGL